MRDEPRRLREAGSLVLKGFCMGTADVIPGVSGGTMALILGIYERLVSAIASIDGPALRAALRLRLGEALHRVHWRFLLALGTGIGLAVLSFARVLPVLLETYPTQVRGLFFGLIVASSAVVLRRVEEWSGAAVLAGLVGGVAAYVLVGLLPVQTPEHLGFIFLCGVLGISAMILPGISGAFILLILGKWKFMLEAVHQRDVVVLGVFFLGCAVGLLSFVRLLRALLDRWRGPTLAAMIGLMLGSLRKLWPFKETLKSVVVEGRTLVVAERNLLPESLGPGEWLALLLLLAGLVAVALLEWWAHWRPPGEPRPGAGELEPALGERQPALPR